MTFYESGILEGGELGRVGLRIREAGETEWRYIDPLEERLIERPRR